jgi:hypothetical protein
MSRGAILLYNGQEVGEPGAGSEGFGGDDARTSIFDYWSMPQFVKWVNGHNYDGGRLSPQQKELRDYYGRLINLVGEPAFRDGKFFPLNRPNRDNPHFGRLPGETASGHWLYAFLRYDPLSGQRCLVVANLHAATTMVDVRIIFSPDALRFLGLENRRINLRLVERLSGELSSIGLTTADAATNGMAIAVIPALNAFYFELA